MLNVHILVIKIKLTILQLPTLWLLPSDTVVSLQGLVPQGSVLPSTGIGHIYVFGSAHIMHRDSSSDERFSPAINAFDQTQPSTLQQ